jgi:hypothetical protein
LQVQVLPDAPFVSLHFLGTRIFFLTNDAENGVLGRSVAINPINCRGTKFNSRAQS